MLYAFFFLIDSSLYCNADVDLLDDEQWSFRKD